MKGNQWFPLPPPYCGFDGFHYLFAMFIMVVYGSWVVYESWSMMGCDGGCAMVCDGVRWCVLGALEGVHFFTYIGLASLAGAKLKSSNP